LKTGTWPCAADGAGAVVCAQSEEAQQKTKTGENNIERNRRKEPLLKLQRKN
jgi:hypothetical protein